MPEWIVIPKWDEFQHYKDRAPKWIKTYVELMSDAAYLELSGHQRAVLHGLWLEYASARCRLAVDTGSLTRRLNLRVTRRTLERLNQAGFITFSASEPLAMRSKIASPDRRREETPKPPSGTASKGPFICGVNGCTVTHPTEKRIAEHRENVHDIAPTRNGAVPVPVGATYDDELAATVDLDQTAGTLEETE
jgi:hypothetical protein